MIKKFYKLVLMLFFGLNAFAQPVVPASTPTALQANVLSLYSNAYTNVPIDTWRTSWSNATLTDLQIAGNDTKLYSNLDFVGVEFTGANIIDATTMQYYHIDVWTANATTFRAKLVDFGANAVYGGGDDVEYEYVMPTLTLSGWNSYDIPLTAFTGLTNRAHLAQMIFSALPTATANVYIDNVYFYKSTTTLPTVPTTAAPTPTVAIPNVLSLFSNAYTNVPIDTWRTSWSNATLTDLQIAGNDTKLYSNLDFVGVEFTGANIIDATTMQFYHLDVWTANATTFRAKLVDYGANAVYGGGDDVEYEYVMPTLTLSGWNSYDIPLTAFTGLTNRAHLAQMIFSALPTAAANVYIDNVYFYKLPPTLPIVAAPTPTVVNTNVISMFSNAYTNVPIDTWRTSWSAATLTDLQIAGNDTKLYSNLDFVGVEFTGANIIDATTMQYYHIDVWTANATTFRVKLVDYGPNAVNGGGDDVEYEVVVPGLTQSGWNSYNIPLTAFTGLTNRAHLAQMIFSALPTATANVYIDNVYFYKAAPLPITLVNFTATKNKNLVTLNWSTLTELNNKGFEIEKSTDGINYNSIGFVNGNANSVSKINYASVDTKPAIGANYYRLKQIDINGRFSNSAIQVVKFSQTDLLSFSFFPNPAKDLLKINVGLIESNNATIKLINILGQTIVSQSINKSSATSIININVSTLKAGIYFIELNDGINKSIEKVVIN